MKKIIYLIIPLILVIILILFSSKETTIKNPRGTSKTYKYLEKLNTNKYNITIKNEDTKINIVKDHNKEYIKTTSGDLTNIIIEKNNYKYAVDGPTKTYTKEKINKNDNFLEGYYLDKDQIKNKTYKKGKKIIGIALYNYEKYNYSKGTITYYYIFNKLKYIENRTPLKENKIKIMKTTNKIDKNIFKIPKYQEITY